MVGLVNLFPHPDGAVDMPATGLWREIIANVRLRVIEQNVHNVAELDVTAGGTFVLSITNRYAKKLIRLIGTPGAGFTVEMADGNKQIEFENVAGQTATIESTTGAASAPTIPTGETRLLQLRGADFTVLGLVGLQVGALIHSGQVSPTAGINFADFEIKRPLLVDYAFVSTSPSSSAGTLTLDLVLGNYFDVTLTENVTTLNFNNPAATGKVSTLFFIAKQDSGGGNVITWPASVKWETDTGDSPAQTTSGNAVDIYYFFTLDAGTTWYGVLLGLNMG